MKDCILLPVSYDSSYSEEHFSKLHLLLIWVSFWLELVQGRGQQVQKNTFNGSPVLSSFLLKQVVMNGC